MTRSTRPFSPIAAALALAAAPAFAGPEKVDYPADKGVLYGVVDGADMRNGEWEYRSFAPDGKANDKADLKPCFACHLKMKDADYVFSGGQMKSASR